MKELIKAVNAVMADVENIDKNLTVGSGTASYKGVGDKDVKLAFNKAMRENGLAMFPTKVEPTTRIERWTEDTQYGPKQKQSIFTEVVTTYTLYHESGHSVELQGYGHGTDSQDKAAGKATTYAMKYTLLYTFVTATGHIDDADNTHSNDIEAPKAKPKMTSAILEKVVKAVFEGQATIEQAKGKYDVSEVQENEIKEKVQNLAQLQE
jgi:hypothetical protein